MALSLTTSAAALDGHIGSVRALWPVFAVLAVLAVLAFVAFAFNVRVLLGSSAPRRRWVVASAVTSFLTGAFLCVWGLALEEERSWRLVASGVLAIATGVAALVRTAWLRRGTR